MKLIIAAPPGERRFSALLRAIHASGLKASEVTEVVTDGTHPLAAMWATAVGLPLKRFEAKERVYGRYAVKSRNVSMCVYADTILALGAERSRNVNHMIQTAERMGLRIMAHPIAGGE